MTTTHEAPTGATHDVVTPDRIFEIAQGFMASKHLFAASELGLFEALGEGPADLDGLAARTGLPRRTARISADAMVAIGLLERHGDRYANSQVSAAFLAGATPADFRPLLKFWDRLSYPVWADLAGALSRGRPARDISEIDDELVPLMSAGIAAATAAAGRALPEAAGLPAGSRVLDIGGGTGSWSVALAATDPALTATVFETAEVARIAQQELRASEYSDRVDVLVGDVLVDDLPRGFDAFLVANLVHYFTPETNQSILRRIRAVAEPGARLLLADFWTDATHTRPLPAALMAGEFAIHVNDGDVYSVDEGTAWLRETGWRYLDHRPLAGPMSVIVAETA
ncbi:O-methyltransferase [Actinokineospora alba]|uniref:O-methyltransferase n=1 Tax=Actinokineospora alba TaxID=504798 RepID=A0A1H0F0M9_9PSEU|nr:class I SAM-dependent methyltransferase [Actinokineospora alba]TDP69295.1 O-methyltransferase [Actinokineospora alba]SDI19988.1 O-methyltransferase [Actinokineospora alba]SDN88099.1 O-methyltransferase [Actinokineospora alba]